ncbi:hypothetical protein Taro_042582 [Colocasia esculenta]|uniref:Uncharacterized protein n=1 Tax=Colocasia esculenta TaxID=4460 RepID=A0A843WPY7_COLES|nr:hypothetical protein [Colocasia esculenta]
MDLCLLVPSASWTSTVGWHPGVTRGFFFPHFLLSSSPTFPFVLLHYFRRSTGARGKAVVRVVAADQAGNDGLEGGIRGKLLGVQCKSRFYRGDAAIYNQWTAIDAAANLCRSRVTRTSYSSHMYRDL